MRPSPLSTARAQAQNASRAERLLWEGRNQPTGGSVELGQYGLVHEFSMHIDRASTEKFVAMLGLTLSFLLVLAVIAFAFV